MAIGNSESREVSLMTSVQDRTQFFAAIESRPEVPVPSERADRGLRMAGVAGVVLWAALLWFVPRDASAGREVDILAGRPLTTLSGEQASLSLAGAVTVVHFWASWCAP
jgi:hypothetical protein